MTKQRQNVFVNSERMLKTLICNMRSKLKAKRAAVAANSDQISYIVRKIQFKFRPNSHLI